MHSLVGPLSIASFNVFLLIKMPSFIGLQTARDLKISDSEEPDSGNLVSERVSQGFVRSTRRY